MVKFLISREVVFLRETIVQFVLLVAITTDITSEAHGCFNVIICCCRMMEVLKENIMTQKENKTLVFVTRKSHADVIARKIASVGLVTNFVLINMLNILAQCFMYFAKPQMKGVHH